MHTALNLHFNPSVDYDFFKYNGKTKVKLESFKKSPFRWQYGGIESKTDHLLWFFYNRYKQVGFKYLPPKALFYSQQKLVDRPETYMSTVVRDDLIALRAKYQGGLELFDSDGLHPSIYNDYHIRGAISIETLLLIDIHIREIFALHNSRDPISWPMIVQEMDDIRLFIRVLFDQQQFLGLFESCYLNGE